MAYCWGLYLPLLEMGISIAVGFNRRHKGHHIEPSEINFTLHILPLQWSE